MVHIGDNKYFVPIMISWVDFTAVVQMVGLSIPEAHRSMPHTSTS